MLRAVCAVVRCLVWCLFARVVVCRPSCVYSLFVRVISVCVVCCSVVGVGCLLFVVWYFVVRCLLCVVRCVFFRVCCVLMFAVCCVLFVGVVV